MKKVLSIGLAALMAAGTAAQAGRPNPPDFKTYTKAIAERAHATSQQWRHAATPATPAKAPQQIVTAADAQTSPVSFWGTLFVPSGEEWMYTADYTFSPTPSGAENISGADITIYDADLKKYAQLHADFSLGEHETGINYIELVPTLSRKFFNINDAYEVMIMVHATTDDYSGHIYTQVYTLSDGSLVTTIEGNNIGAVNTATDSWSEKYTMVFMREGLEITDDEYNYSLAFDVYSKAGWGTGCTLEHTFNIDYELVAGAGNYALPILLTENGGHLYYTLPYYEKPYFVNSFDDDVNPDNNFVIDLYDEGFNLLKTTKIPITLEGESIFSFPGLGELFGNGDVCFGEYTDGPLPAYIVGVENYIASSDDFTTSLYVYNSDGERIKTIATEVVDYLQMSSVPGQPEQFCFYYPAADLGYFSMVDFPACTERAYIPLRLGDYNESPNITTSIDRVPIGSSYQYVSSLAMAETNDQGDALHMIAWFKDDGAFDRFDTVNLGQDIAVAQPNIDADALNPYLFNTDSSIEYMFLVKKYRDWASGSSASDELFRIYGANNELLLEMGPDPQTGEVLNSIFLFNPNTDKTKLVVVYYLWNTNTYTVRHIDLPLTKYSGEGTAANPYLIETAGHMMAMYLYPSAQFALASDIDFGGIQWGGNKIAFRGTLDGAGHTVTNLNLTGSIFETMSGKATVKDLNISGVQLKLADTGGVIAGMAVGDNGSPVISNVHIAGLEATGVADMIGGIVGLAAGHTEISACSVEGSLDCSAITGGIAGRLTTGTTISACKFQGSISAPVAGGICGESFTGDETIENCHVSALVEASSTAGGIIGESGRTFVHHCIVEGSVKATGSREISAGGIVGSLKSTYEAVDAPVVYDNITLAAVSANPAATRALAHRVAGFTSGDEMLVNWDSKDPSVDWSDPSTYPYYKGDPEKAMADNYAIGVDVVDAEVADAADTAEGKTLEAADAAFLEALGFKTGSSVDAPWMAGGKVLVLWYEGGQTGITGPIAERPVLKVERGVLKAEGEIVVYSISGTEVARGRNTVDTDHLSRGVYVATSGNAKLKFMVR